MQDMKLSEVNPLRAGPDWAPAVIAGAYQTGVLGMRSLARRGVRVCCFDTDRRYEGFRSVHGEAHLCPNPDADPVGWIAFMIALSRKIGGRPVLISSADQFVSAIANHESALTPHFVVSTGARLQGLLATKEHQYELAANHGMPLPRTRFVKTFEDVADFAREAQFPCVLKPTHFREWQRLPVDHPLHDTKVAIADTPAQLSDSWRLASAINPHVIVQEIIQGPDSAKRVWLSCYDRESRRIGAAIFRELRCLPVGFGPATVSEPVDDPETDAVCDGFMRRIGYSGICEIEMKWDSRDGQVKLIEANPRLSGGGDAAPYAGVDLCWLHYLDLISRPVTPVRPNGRDFRHVVVRSDLSAIISYRRANLISWMDVFRSYKPPLAFFDLDLRDWRSSARTVYLMLRSAASTVLRGLRGRSKRTRG